MRTSREIERIAKRVAEKLHVRLYLLYTNGVTDDAVGMVLDRMTDEALVLDFLSPLEQLFFVVSNVPRHHIFIELENRLPHNLPSRRYPRNGPWLVLTPISFNDISGVLPPEMTAVWEWLKQAETEKNPARFPLPKTGIHVGHQ